MVRAGVTLSMEQPLCLLTTLRRRSLGTSMAGWGPRPHHPVERAFCLYGGQLLGFPGEQMWASAAGAQTVPPHRGDPVGGLSWVSLVKPARVLRPLLPLDVVCLERVLPVSSVS